jgi:hypothetical protein
MQFNLTQRVQRKLEFVVPNLNDPACCLFSSFSLLNRGRRQGWAPSSSGRLVRSHRSWISCVAWCARRRGEFWCGYRPRSVCGCRSNARWHSITPAEL